MSERLTIHPDSITPIGNWASAKEATIIITAYRNVGESYRVRIAELNTKCDELQCTLDVATKLLGELYIENHCLENIPEEQDHG